MTEELTADETTFYDNVPGDGEAVGNTALRRSLGWVDAKYWDVRNSLIDKNLLILGKGQGGSVRRNISTLVAAQAAPEPGDAATDADERSGATEQALYAPIAEVLESKWTKDLLLDEFFIQTTANQGRRETGGTWTRPDVVAVYVSTYQNLPGKFVDVVAFEVKTSKNCDLTAVYEALAHLRAATRSYVIVVVPKDDAPALSKLLADMEDEAVRHGIGFIVVSDVKNYDTWEFHVDAQPHTPDPAKLDEFIERQLSEENKKRLRKWIK